jgi:hypothetical protein
MRKNYVYTTKAWATRKSVTNWKKGFKVLFYLWHPACCLFQKPVKKSHMVKSHTRRITRTDLQLVQSEHISVHSWHLTNWWMVNLQIYNWRPILYKKETLGSVAPCQYQHITNKSLTGNANTGTSFQLKDLIVHMKLLLGFFYIEMEYSQ